MKGLIDENAVAQYTVQEAGENVRASASDAEYVSNIVSVKTLKLVVVNTEQTKTRPGGRFFKYYRTTQFDLIKYGLYEADNDPYSSDLFLVIAFREGGMSDAALQMVKLFAMNRKIPKCN